MLALLDFLLQEVRHLHVIFVVVHDLDLLAVKIVLELSLDG